MTHPTNPPTDPAAEDDFALLNDLLDGRLDEEAADRARARIEAEPALGELHEELLSVRACVRGYGPQGADLQPPADFLERVRAAIGATADSSIPGPSASVAEAPAAPAAARPRGRMLRMFAVAYAAAALMVVGFSVHYLLRDRGPASEPLETAKQSQPTVLDARSAKRPETEETESAPEEVRDLLDIEAERLARRRLSEARETEKKSEPTRPGRFGGPGGAIPPGTRTPSDPDPADLPEARARGGGRRPATPPSPTTPAAPPSMDPPPTAEPADAGKPAGALSSGEIVYVFVARNAAGARLDLKRLLAGVEVGASKARSKGEDKVGAGSGPSPPRLYKVTDPKEVARLLAARFEGSGLGLAEGRVDGAGGGAGGSAGKQGAPIHAVVDTVVRRLDPAAWRRLERLVANSTWQGAKGPRKRAPAPDEDDTDAGAGDGSEPKDVEPARKLGKAKEAGGVPAPVPAPAPPPRPAAPGKRKVRVRILIVEEQ